METQNPRLPRAREEDLIVQDLPDEVLVYDVKRHRAHSLNRTAALVWRACNGQTTFTEMAAILHRELNLPQDEDVVRLALDRLGRARLLAGRVPRPADAANTSRRALIRRLSLVGGLAMLLPVVDSITSPAAAQTVSFIDDDLCNASNVGKCCSESLRLCRQAGASSVYQCNGDPCGT
jgi:hypothetical protein